MNPFGNRQKQLVLLVIGVLTSSLSITPAACNFLLPNTRMPADARAAVVSNPLPDNPIRPLLGVNAGPAPVGAFAWESKAYAP